MVAQIRVPWTVPNAGPSVTTLYLSSMVPDDATLVSNAIMAFFDAQKAFLPNDVSINRPPEAQILSTLTGELTDVIPMPGGSTVTGTQAGSWAGGAGYRVVWPTNGIVAGRRVRGSTFMVPAAVQAFDVNGQTSTGVRTAGGNAAAAYLTSLGLTALGPVVWSRPAPGRPGSTHLITGDPYVAPMAATLRGRKA